MKKIKFLLTFFPLTLGILIYLLYRSRKLFYYNFIHLFNINGYIVLARESAHIYRPLFPTWVIYSLPDGLWIFSVGSLILLCRNRYFLHLIWFLFIYLLTILQEYLQKFFGGHGTAVGTFDKTDIVAFTYAFVTIVLISLVFRKIDNKFRYKENLYVELSENIFYSLIFFIIGILPNMF